MPLRTIAASGTGIVLITHHLAEVFAISNEVTRLREGAVVLSCPTTKTNMSGLIGQCLDIVLQRTDRSGAGVSSKSTKAAPPQIGAGSWRSKREINARVSQISPFRVGLVHYHSQPPNPSS